MMHRQKIQSVRPSHIPGDFGSVRGWITKRPEQTLDKMENAVLIGNFRLYVLGC